jgi:type VI protein secretion system component Hcp
MHLKIIFNSFLKKFQFEFKKLIEFFKIEKFIQIDFKKLIIVAEASSMDAEKANDRSLFE